MEQKTTKIDITWKSIIRFFVVCLAILCLFYFKQIILWIFLALVISFLFNPIIDVMERKKISRPVAAGIIYGAFVIIVIWVILSIFPPLIKELSLLTNNISLHNNEFMDFLAGMGVNISSFGDFAAMFQEQIIGIIQNAVSFAGSILEQVFAFITIFTLALFLSIEKQFPINFARIFAIKKESEGKVLSAFNESQRQVIGYFNAKLIASIFIVITTLIFLSIINVKYALSLSIISGVFNIIPIIGPVISCLLIMFFAIFDSWIKALVVLVFCIVIQQIESNLLIPILTKKIIGIPTVLVLVSVLIGAKLGGIFGAIFIIPVAGIIYEFIQKYFKEKKERIRSLS